MFQVSPQWNKHTTTFVTSGRHCYPCTFQEIGFCSFCADLCFLPITETIDDSHFVVLFLIRWKLIRQLNDLGVLVDLDQDTFVLC